MAIDAEQALFLDDLAINCEAAEAAGMQAVLYESPAQAIAEVEAALAAS
jgi:putative hydrolase of the HAD superfamily